MCWNYKIRKKNCVKNDTINLKYHYVLIFIVELKVLVYSYPFVKEYDVNIRSVNKPVNFGKNIKKFEFLKSRLGLWHYSVHFTQR